LIENKRLQVLAALEAVYNLDKEQAQLFHDLMDAGTKNNSKQEIDRIYRRSLNGQ
jgi:hypothetical protein